METRNIPGKVALWPPNGGSEPSYFLEQKVEQQLLMGWTLEPAKPKRPAPRAPVRTSASTDKPKTQSQGPEKEDSP